MWCLGRIIKLCVSSFYIEAKLINLAKELDPVAEKDMFRTEIIPKFKLLLVLVSHPHIPQYVEHMLADLGRSKSIHSFTPQTY